MNTTVYIQSGAIESCVLGLASADEQQELQALCAQYPEVLDARVSFELALAAQLMKGAVEPPEGVKEKIFSAILDEPDLDIVPQKVSSVPMFNVNRWKWLAAACLIAVVTTMLLTYHLAKENMRLQTVNRELNNRLDHSNHTDALLALKPVIDKPSVVWSTMLDPQNTAHCAAHIYWDTLSANTYLLLGNIPSPLTARQFQLWAMTGERSPVSLGTFDISKEGQLLQMKQVQNAKAFIITVEPKGGSKAPTTNSTYAVSRQL